MLSFRVDDEEAAEAQRWATRLGVDRSEVAVVGQGQNIEASISCALILKRIGVPWVIAKAETDIHGEILTKVGIPRAMPYLFASLKVAITLAFIGSVISETVGGNNGIGFLMLSASARNDAPTTFAGLFAIAIMGVVMYAICALVEKRMTRWAFRGELVS